MTGHRTSLRGLVYERARRWLHDEGVLPGHPLDNHQVWAIVDAYYPGGWAAFTVSQGDPS